MNTEQTEQTPESTEALINIAASIIVVILAANGVPRGAITAAALRRIADVAERDDSAHEGPAMPVGKSDGRMH